MQFTTRQLLLWFTALAVWFGAMTQGHYLFGPYGVAVFGSLFGISILLMVKMVGCWSKWSHLERGMSVLALILSLSAGIYLADVAFGHGYHLTREKVREAQRLQVALLADHRYGSVVATYELPRRKRSGRLWVRGSVANQEFLDSLHQTIDDDGKWTVEWDVEIVRE